MSFFNEEVIKAMSTGRYICSQCGEDMEFENEYEDTLVCLACGHNIDIDRYGFEDDEDYNALYPTEEEVLGRCGDGGEDDDEYSGETYEEVCGELDD
jgi:DNA-directed RNA polymerase subunit RPC12/RpoP